jgi:uncharacterized NAD(P)/FAD-binding protein YdhS
VRRRRFTTHHGRIINGLRASIQDIWQNLSITEQARFLRHLRPFWDAHRHRLPIEVHGQLQAELRSGQAALVQARVTEVVPCGDGFEIKLTCRGSAETLRVDLAFDCSGHAPDLQQPLLKELGLARPDAHRLGLAVAGDGEIRHADGCARKGLFAVGPLCQGSLWEITAVPEIVA